VSDYSRTIGVISIHISEALRIRNGQPASGSISAETRMKIATIAMDWIFTDMAFVENKLDGLIRRHELKGVMSDRGEEE